jgi:hypothetical protein
MNRVPIGATIAASFNYIGVAWRRAGLAMAFLVGVQVLEGILRVATPRAAGVISLVALVPLIAFGTVAFGALYRIGVERAPSDPEFRLGGGGVQWTGLEWRVLGANIIVGVILALVVLAASILWIIALGVSLIGHINEVNAMNAAASPADRLAALARLMMGPAGLVTLVIGLVAAALLLWLSAKLSLFAIFAADTRRFDIGQAWAMTRGATWALIVTGVVILIAQLAASFVFGVVGGLAAGLAGASAPLMGQLFGSVAAAAITTPLTAGMQVAVYRARRPGGAAVADAFA